jgi:hypothetical protein
MRNKIAVLLFTGIFGCLQIQAQSEGNSRLPQKGNLSFGINAVPVLIWAGNTLNGNVNNTSIGDEKFTDNSSPLVTVKYVYNENSFLRFSYLGGRNINRKENLVWDNSIINSPNSLVTDVSVTKDNFWGLGLGIEKRKSNGNLQGYIGADLFYVRDKNETNYFYGNSFSQSNQTPTSTYDFDNRLSKQTGTRTIMVSNGINNTIALRSFVGAEYFIAKGISLGVEYGLNFAYSMGKEGIVQTETFDAARNSVFTNVQKSGGKAQYTDGLDNQGGAILLNFYF